jgi:hypothetical protein
VYATLGRLARDGTPDGNEIELYCDAPRTEREGRVRDVMAVRALDLG